MNRRDERRIACERLKGGRFITLEAEGQSILVGLEVGALPPGAVVVQVAPDARARVQRGARRGPEEPTHVLREGQLGGGLRATVVQQEEIPALREGRRTGLDDERAPLGVQRRPCEDEASPRGRLDRPVDRQPREGGRATLRCAVKRGRTLVESVVALTSTPGVRRTPGRRASDAANPAGRRSTCSRRARPAGVRETG